MPFCPNDKSMLLPIGGVLQCKKCGYSPSGPAESKKIKHAAEQKEILILDKEAEDKLEVMPKMRAECPNCGNNEAWYRTQQTRKSDEPETAFLRCTKCDHRWRKY
jgi:transcription factor S